MPKLTEQQKRFAESYIKTMDAGRSAIEAGYSERSAPSQGSKLLQKPQVKAHIAQLSSNIQEKTEVEVTEIVQALRKIAFAGAETKTTNSDRLRALELLGKTLALYSDRYISENNEIETAEDLSPAELNFRLEMAKVYKQKAAELPAPAKGVG